MVQERELMTAAQIAERFGIPLYAVYRMANYGRIKAHEMPRDPWQKRRRLGFDPADVARALGQPEP